MGGAGVVFTAVMEQGKCAKATTSQILLCLCLLELSVQGSKVYLGSIVSVRWMGVWYDGTVVQIGPHSNLFKVSIAIAEGWGLSFINGY